MTSYQRLEITRWNLFRFREFLASIRRSILDTFTESIFVEQLQRASSEGVQLQYSFKMKPRHGVTENEHALRSSFFCQKR